MEKQGVIRQLPTELRSYLRSGVAITSVTQCVEELLLNSLDAGATCVAVRLDLSAFKVQVVDNGVGIPEDQLQLVGNRYSTSKCHTIENLENLCYFGYRGEALASIQDACSVLEVTTRTKQSMKTFCKLFQKGKALPSAESKIPRPSVGTTVTVYNLFDNFPVRRKAVNEALELERIRQRVEGLALIRPGVSISLRNDLTGNVLLHTHKCSSSLTTFSHLFGATKSKCLAPVGFSKGHFTLSGYIGKEGHSKKEYQFVYINGRLVLKTKVHKLFNQLLSKCIIFRRKVDISASPVIVAEGQAFNTSPTKHTNKFPIFVIDVKCPLAEYDITFDPAKTLVEFKDWDLLLSCTSECIDDFLKRENIFYNNESSKASLLTPEVVQDSETKSEISPSNIKDTLISKAAKRVMVSHEKLIDTVVCVNNEEISNKEMETKSSVALQDSSVEDIVSDRNATPAVKSQENKLEEAAASSTFDSSLNPSSSPQETEGTDEESLLLSSCISAPESGSVVKIERTEGIDRSGQDYLDTAEEEKISTSTQLSSDQPEEVYHRGYGVSDYAMLVGPDGDHGGSKLELLSNNERVKDRKGDSVRTEANTNKGIAFENARHSAGSVSAKVMSSLSEFRKSIGKTVVPGQKISLECLKEKLSSVKNRFSDESSKPEVSHRMLASSLQKFRKHPKFADETDCCSGSLRGCGHDSETDSVINSYEMIRKLRENTDTDLGHFNMLQGASAQPLSGSLRLLSVEQKNDNHRIDALTGTDLRGEKVLPSTSRNVLCESCSFENSNYSKRNYSSKEMEVRSESRTITPVQENSPVRRQEDSSEASVNVDKMRIPGELDIHDVSTRKRCHADQQESTVASKLSRLMYRGNGVNQTSGKKQDSSDWNEENRISLNESVHGCQNDTESMPQIVKGDSDMVEDNESTSVLEADDATELMSVDKHLIDTDLEESQILIHKHCEIHNTECPASLIVCREHMNSGKGSKESPSCDTYYCDNRSAILSSCDTVSSTVTDVGPRLFRALPGAEKRPTCAENSLQTPVMPFTVSSFRHTEISNDFQDIEEDQSKMKNIAQERYEDYMEEQKTPKACQQYSFSIGEPESSLITQKSSDKCKTDTFAISTSDENNHFSSTQRFTPDLETGTLETGLQQTQRFSLQLSVSPVISDNSEPSSSAVLKDKYKYEVSQGFSPTMKTSQEIESNCGGTLESKSYHQLNESKDTVNVNSQILGDTESKLDVSEWGTGQRNLSGQNPAESAVDVECFESVDKLDPYSAEVVVSKVNVCLSRKNDSAEENSVSLTQLLRSTSLTQRTDSKNALSSPGQDCITFSDIFSPSPNAAGVQLEKNVNEAADDLPKEYSSSGGVSFVKCSSSKSIPVSRHDDDDVAPDNFQENIPTKTFDTETVENIVERDTSPETQLSQFSQFSSWNQSFEQQVIQLSSPTSQLMAEDEVTESSVEVVDVLGTSDSPGGYHALRSTLAHPGTSTNIETISDETATWVKVAEPITDQPHKDSDEHQQATASRSFKCPGLSPATASVLKVLLKEHMSELEADAQIKWRDSTEVDCVADDMPDTYTDDSVAKLFAEWDNPVFPRAEQEVLKASVTQVSKSMARAYRTMYTCQFTKSMLDNLKVIGQVDKKFIACLLNTDDCNQSAAPDMLVVVDQHAAHERVRLEALTEAAYETIDDDEEEDGDDEMVLRQLELDPPESLALSDDIVRIMLTFKREFSRIGVKFSQDNSQRNSILVKSIPACFVEREINEVKRKRDSVAWTLVETLIKEHVELLRTTQGAQGRLPQTIHKLLCSQACHGAIKFGDALTDDECQDLLKSLAQCRLPFQCAHGRPSIMPVLHLEQLGTKLQEQKRNLPKLHKLTQQLANRREVDNVIE